MKTLMVLVNAGMIVTLGLITRHVDDNSRCDDVTGISRRTDDHSTSTGGIGRTNEVHQRYAHYQQKETQNGTSSHWSCNE